MNELLIKKANLLEQARTALKAGNLEEGKRLRQEAETVQGLIEETAAVDSQIAKSVDLQRVPLPGMVAEPVVAPPSAASARAGRSPGWWTAPPAPHRSPPSASNGPARHRRRRASPRPPAHSSGP